MNIPLGIRAVVRKMVFDAGADDLGETMRKMSARGGKLITTNGFVVLAKPFLGAIVMEGCWGDGG